MREALRRGHEAFWATDADVGLDGNAPVVRASGVVECAKNALPSLGQPASLPVERFDAALIRKDPPFDAAYVRLCWMLALAEPKVAMINRPSLLLRYHEKLIPLEAVRQGFLRAEDVLPLHVGAKASADAFVRERGLSEVVTKPFLGHGGNAVERVPSERFLAGKHRAPDDTIVQPFEPDVLTRGDRRVFFLDGEVLAHFVRRPPPGGFVSNLAKGGVACREPLDPEQEAVLRRLGAFLRSAGLVLAGADLIGRRVSEVNVTSPTGLRSLEALEGNDYAAPILDRLERGASPHR